MQKKYSRDEIIAQTKVLAEIISENDDVKLYAQAEQKLNANQRVQELITQIKHKQQELVNAKHFKKVNYIKQLEQDLDLLNKELHDIPLVRQYQDTQKDLNKFLQSIFSILKEELSKNLPLENEK